MDYRFEISIARFSLFSRLWGRNFSFGRPEKNEIVVVDIKGQNTSNKHFSSSKRTSDRAVNLDIVYLLNAVFFLAGNLVRIFVLIKTWSFS